VIALVALGICVLGLALFAYLETRGRPAPRRGRRRAEPASPPEASHGRNRRKPDWVREEVLRLKALIDVGCRKIADTFNLLHAHRGETVGHSFVAMLVKTEAEKILRIRREIKHRKPGRMPRNLVWALDLTFLPGEAGSRAVFGLVDHGSRLCLSLRELRDRSTIGVLRLLLDAFERFGRPKSLRTDNEPVFVSRLFRFVLWLLGIRHQRTAPHCPWQNGRIERLFRTIKERLLGWFDEAGVPADLGEDLEAVRAWYNHLRPHQHLDGITPAMAWNGRRPTGRYAPRFVSFWNGRLSGYFFPP
jgi:transposase InsO family protein